MSRTYKEIMLTIPNSPRQEKMWLSLMTPEMMWKHLSRLATLRLLRDQFRSGERSERTDRVIKRLQEIEYFKYAK